jgi:biotin synthase
MVNAVALREKLIREAEPDLSWQEVAVLLESKDKELEEAFFMRAKAIRDKFIGKKAYFRGLVEMSNICAKNCLYCGIRADNAEPHRYKMSFQEVMDACQFAYERGYGSVVLQSGEISSVAFINEITDLLTAIQQKFDGRLRVTLSCGEQSEETYQRWYDAGAHRYLLRIETSDPEFYRAIHPNDRHHDFEERVNCLRLLRKVGYQVGSGIMIGLPGQNYAAVARDLMFLKEMDVDMVGMGPYIEHEETPLWERRDQLWPLRERLAAGIKAVAALRILMKDINIAAATALQAIDPKGREQALDVGANVIMPNLTPIEYRKDYSLYENKPCTDEDRGMCSVCLEGRVKSIGLEVARDQWGDSIHYHDRQKKS